MSRWRVNKMYDLSIIMPIYNAVDYIKDTVEILLKQNIPFMEIILVDDGSTDGSEKICDELSNSYEQIKCLHIENGGPGHARNCGIECAQGEYVGFCDADDKPSEDMYRILLNTMKKNKANLCLCDIYSERDGRNFGFPWKGGRIFCKEENIDILLASMLGNVDDDCMEVPVWGSSVRSLYMKKILDEYGIRFPTNIRFAEDLVFNIRYIKHCIKSVVIDKVLYHYTFNETSLMNSYRIYQQKMYEERCELIENIMQEIVEIDKTGELRKRFLTSQRCYFHECIGNSARAISEKGWKYAYREIKMIVNSDIVRVAFADLKIHNMKRKLLYNLIKNKNAAALCVYYGIRLRRK